MSIIIPKQPNFSLDDFSIRNPININGIAISIPLITSLEFGSPNSGVGRYLPLGYPSEEIRESWNVLENIIILFPFVAILQKEGVSLTLLGVQGITTHLQSHNIREAHTIWYEYPLPYCCDC